MTNTDIIEELKKGLAQIIKMEGRYHLSDLQHAKNIIEDNAGIAKHLLVRINMIDIDMPLK